MISPATRSTILARAGRMACAGLLCALCLAPAWAADSDSGGFIVRTAYTELLDGVYFLNADMDLGLSRDAIDALESGVPLTVEVQIEVIRHRSYIWDSTVATLTQRYQISFHALSRRYLVRNLNSGREESYESYRGAITALGHINDLPVIDASLLEKGERYDIRMRAVLDIKDFPAPLQLIASLWSDWRLSSAWYRWVLQS